MRGAAIGLLLLLASAAGATAAFADARPLFEPDGRAICTGRTGNRTVVGVVPDGDGGVLAVTSDPLADTINGPDGGMDAGLLRLGPDLASRPVHAGPGGSDPCGALLFGGTADQTPWRVFDEGDGRFAVAAFERSFAAFDIRRPFLGRFDRTGAMLMGQGLAFPAVPGTIASGIEAAPDGAGGYFIVWEDDVPPLYFTGHFLVRRVDQDGAPLWDAPVRLTLEVTSNPFSLAIRADGHGGAWVAWEENRNPILSDGWRYYVQHVTADGTLTAGPGGVRLLDASAAHYPAELVAAGEDVIVLLGQGGPIRAYRIAPGGSLPWGQDGKQVGRWGIDDHLVDLRAIDAGEGTFYVLWHEASGYIGVGDRMRVRRMRQDGTFAWPADVVALEYRDGFVAGTGGFSLLPGGELAIAATSLGYQTTDSDIYGQVIDRRGRTKMPSTGAVVCGAPFFQRSPRVFPPSLFPGPDLAAPPGSVQALFLWTDPRLLDGDDFFVQGMTFTSRPILNPPAVVPEIRQGESIALDFEGDDLAPGAVVETDPGLVVENVTVGPVDPDWRGDRIAVTLRAAPGGVGPHGLAVVNPDGSRAVLAEALRIRLDAQRIDTDGSGRVDGYDLAILASAFGRGRGEALYSAAADIDGSGLVDGVDLAFVAGRFGQPPSD